MIIFRIEDIEKRFKEVSGINTDISIYPLVQQDDLQVETRKDKSKEHGEVFTPLWLVDKMIDQVPKKRFKKILKTLDPCSGYGQFTIRLIRKYYSIHGECFDLDLFFEKHWMTELQPSSAYKLLYIFGNKINIAVGDTMRISELHDDARGIYFYSEQKNKWENKTQRALKMSASQFQQQYMKLDGVK